MASGAATAERRAQRRVPAYVEVRYGTGGEFFLAQTCDISPYGVGVIGPRLYPIGTELDLRFRAPREGTGTLMFLRATVRHAIGNRLGLQFVGQTPREMEHLRESIATLAQPE